MSICIICLSWEIMVFLISEYILDISEFLFKRLPLKSSFDLDFSICWINSWSPIDSKVLWSRLKKYNFPIFFLYSERNLSISATLLFFEDNSSIDWKFIAKYSFLEL